MINLTLFIYEHLVAEVLSVAAGNNTGITNQCKNLIQSTKIQRNKTPSHKNNIKEINIIKNIMKKITDNDLKCSKADKGNTVIILPRDTYLNKINEFIGNSSRHLLPKDPTLKISSETRTKVKDLKYYFHGQKE